MNINNEKTPRDGGEDWRAAYPGNYRAVLEQYGVAPDLHDRADAYNRRLVALAEAEGAEGLAFAERAEEAFRQEFGGILGEVNGAAAVEPEHGRRHVDLGAEQQVRLALQIRRAISSFVRGELAALAGVGFDPAGAARLLGGGQVDHALLMVAVEFLRRDGLRHLFPDIDPQLSATLEPIVHTRDSRQQQAAVGETVRELRRRYREGEVQMVVGMTIDDLGRVCPFAGGETDGRLIGPALEALRRFMEEGGEMRFDQ